MKCTNEKIPYFNSPVYLENKEKIGKVDEIFGPIQDYFISVKVRLFEFFVTSFQLIIFIRDSRTGRAKQVRDIQKFVSSGPVQDFEKFSALGLRQAGFGPLIPGFYTIRIIFRLIFTRKNIF